MKLLSSSLLMPVAGTAVIAVFSFLLYQDMTRSSRAGSFEEVGTITFKRKVAERKYSSKVVWEELRQDAPVYNYDTIRTADISEAVIKLKDGTEIALNENSMILLAVTKEDVRVEFARGSINANRDNVSDAGIKKLNISSGNTSVTVGKGDVNLAQGLDKALNLTLNKGGATVKAGDTEQLVGADQKVVVAGEDLRVYKLAIRLLTPRTGEDFVTASGTARVNFSWEALKDGYDVFLELAPDMSFAGPLEKRKVAGTAAAADLRSGVYYWRVSAVQRATGKIESSDVRRFVILRSDPVVLITPPDRMVFRYSSKPPIINFKWSGIDAESEYTLTVARDPEMKSIVKTASLNTPGLATDELDRGSYFWKVTRRIVSTGESAPVASPVFRLAVEQSAAVPPPEPLYPSERMTLNRLALERESITFTWKKNSDLPSFRLAIARDREFANTVYTADSAANFAQVNKALENGAYFWRITGMAEGRPATEPSQAREFRVVESDNIALVRPADGSVLAPAPGDRDVRANFAWQRADMSGRYRLQVSRDGAFSSLDRDITTDDTGHTVSLKDPGEYFWRVLFQDEKGEELMKSAPYRLLVREALGLPLAITPAGGSVVDMSNQSSLSFRWREVKGATLYRISVFQRSGGVNTNIFEKETAGTELALSELEKLDVGNFYWTVQAFEVQGRGNIVRRSAEVKSEFSITLRQFADKPKIKVPKKIYIE